MRRSVCDLCQHMGQHGTFGLESDFLSALSRFLEPRLRSHVTKLRRVCQLSCRTSPSCEENIFCISEIEISFAWSLGMGRLVYYLQMSVKIIWNECVRMFNPSSIFPHRNSLMTSVLWRLMLCFQSEVSLPYYWLSVSPTDRRPSLQLLHLASVLMTIFSQSKHQGLDKH